MDLKNNKTQINKKKDKTNKLDRDKSEERAPKTCGEYLCKTI